MIHRIAALHRRAHTQNIMASRLDLLLLLTSLHPRHAESPLPAPSALLLLLLVLSTAASLLLASLFILPGRRRRSSGGSHNLDDPALFPKGPTPWPIVGNLPLLHCHCLHRALADLSRNHGYGAIMGLRLGSRPAVVVSDPSVARELLLTHDKIFANRPHFAFADAIFYGYNSSTIFSSYSPLWLRLRKVCTLELFTAKRLQCLQFIRQEEVRGLLCHLLDASAGGTRAVDVGKMLADMTANTTTRLVCSKKASDGALPGIIRDLEHETAPVLGDFIPWLAFLDKPKIRSMKKLHQRIDAFIESILAERREGMRTMPAHELPPDFLQVLLSKESGDDLDEGITTREVKAILFDILSGGVHTSAVTTEWAIAELLRNPSCLRRLQEEVDRVMGAEGRQEQQVTDEDVSKLPYLQSVVKEVLRLHPPVPLLLPRVSTEDCKLGGYVLPTGTLVFVNAFAIGRDEGLWGRAESFWPERYMQDRKEADIAEGKEGAEGDGRRTSVNVDVNGQHYELLPFGSGRRMCPGIRLGSSILHITLANLAKFFDWELPEGLSASSIDMGEKGTVAVSKAIPLLAIPKPRGHVTYLHPQ